MWKNEIMPFATTRMGSEGIMLSEISQTEKGKHYTVSLIHGSKDTINQWVKQNISRLTTIEDKLLVTSGERKVGRGNIEVKVKVLRLTLCNTTDCSPCPWDCPGKNPAVGSHSLLQGIFLTQGLTLGLPHCRQILYHLKNQMVIQFSHSIMSDSLWPNGLQQAGFPCPSPNPRTYSNSCPLVMPSKYPILCHPLLLLPSVFPASASFPVSLSFASGSQSTGVSASASVLPMNTQGLFPLGWTGWIPLQSKGLSRVFSDTTVQSINSSVLSFFYSPTLTSIHDHWKNHSFD